MLSLLRQYFRSLSGGPPASHRFDSTFLLMVGSVFAGYTATAFPEQFLKKFEHPIIQFIIFYILALSTSTSKDSIKILAIGDALLTTILFQSSVYLANKYYDNIEGHANHREGIKNMKNNSKNK